MSNKRHFMLLRTSDLILPESFGLRREPPRKPEERQPRYMEKFDFRTLYYDIFKVEGSVVGIGPPLRNLEGFIRSSDIYIDGIKASVSVAELDRIQVTTFSGDFPAGGVLSIDHDIGNISCTIGNDLAHLFEGRNVVVTKSKDNPISWITDWVRYYVSNHEVDSLVLHDNGSTDYTLDDLMDSLRAVPGLEVCVIVEWNYPYGPQGGVWAGNKSIKWDSDYCQYGMLEHARRRLLRNAGVVINHDIDELLVTPVDTSIVDIVKSVGGAGLAYEGRWIETIGTPAAGEPRFFNYSYFDSRRAACTKKWVIAPRMARNAKQWRVHSVVDVKLKESGFVSHRHFMGINNDWKRNRTKAVQFVEGRHLVDDQLSESMAKAFSTPAPLRASGAKHGRRIVGGSHVMEFESKDSSGYPVYWPDDEHGFASTIGPWLVSLIVDEKVRNIRNDMATSSGLVSSGTFLNGLMKPGLTIWGGCAGGRFSTADRERLSRNSPSRVLAVRGRATRDALSSIGIRVDGVLGDPALLLPRFYSPRVSSGGTVVCPDIMHDGILDRERQESTDCRILDVRRSAADVVSDIANASYCVSSSLYGLIVAQAYGVPWLWLRVGDAPSYDGDFQFEDFFSVLDGEAARIDVTLSDLPSLDYAKLANLAGLPKLNFRIEDLLDNFPPDVGSY